MKKTFIFSIILLLTVAAGQNIPTRYFIGRTEVTEEFWMSVPDSLKRSESKMPTDSAIIKEINLQMSHYLDTSSDNGTPSIKRRSTEQIAEIERLIQNRRNNGERIFKVNVGDLVPEIDLIKYLTGKIEKNIIKNGKCYLLSFWATWCGNCLQELKPGAIPHVARQFEDRDDFEFLAICIDSSRGDLNDFFNSDLGSKWNHLTDCTYIDRNREINERFAKGGHMPINILVGTDGRIKYTHFGALTTPEQLSELEDAITNALKQKQS